MIGIVPSTIAADHTRLGEQLREAEAAGADRIQVDIMDGHFVPMLDLVLIMTINPGFDDQQFLPETLPKIARAHQVIRERGLHCDIEVDGRIQADTAQQVAQAGANLLVAGSAIFNARESVAAAMTRLRNAL